MEWNKATIEKDVMQNFPPISTDPWDRNMQVSLNAIDVGITEFNSLIQSFSSIAINLNKLPTPVLVQLQQGADQEFADW